MRIDQATETILMPSPMTPLEDRPSDQLVNELIAKAIVAGPLVHRRNPDWPTIKASIEGLYETAIRIQEIRHGAYR
jgi:hypothetical protein